MMDWKMIKSRFQEMTPKELHENAEQARREKGRLLYEIGERHYMKLRSEGRRDEIKDILAQEVLVFGALSRIEEMEVEAAQKQCKSCRTALEPGAKFCGKCGTAVPRETDQMKVECSTCHTPQRNDQQYCTCCGSEMGQHL
ncbi:zinc ribbon domain-containing protein [Exiguobacterium artemiae]|uniref:zinc ribbon domain-containing protein n=1 Tax=Exiguobacterium artemiae TaxID=340145 RepID=UPI002963F399|nr:zinc ribbon domain-containing protein [Exiguobacterium sibiricum]MDW2886328.1 zinc ribbon domain-containing protein [Exiguobacterium sibiricum]